MTVLLHQIVSSRAGATYRQRAEYGWGDYVDPVYFTCACGEEIEGSRAAKTHVAAGNLATPDPNSVNPQQEGER